VSALCRCGWESETFLFESVIGGEKVGRYSFLGGNPFKRVAARGSELTIEEHGQTRTENVEDPLLVLQQMIDEYKAVQLPGLPRFLGGAVGYFGYDTVRYTERLPNAPEDDRQLHDMMFGFYDQMVVFDQIRKTILVVSHVRTDAPDLKKEYDRACREVDELCERLENGRDGLKMREIAQGGDPTLPWKSDFTQQEFEDSVRKCQEYIRAGDIFQVVLGQRFERKSKADPFDVYRALRAVNPSPYMVYMQTGGSILVASSPEILCRVRRKDSAFIVTNRPLAGTRKRGSTPEEDLALEQDLLADQKERAEHIMLVDLGRNDVGQVAKPGTVQLPAVMEVERYSHVMHISSTVTGELRDGLDCWDALRAALPVGTISGAPKIRAMQIIDELEPIRRGPYGGGMGYVGLDGQMDIALALRTIVVPCDQHGTDGWTYHLQASGGIVADSQHEAEYQETVNKAAALARALALAEAAFTR
jgi:anthranilate synthase component 1